MENNKKMTFAALHPVIETHIVSPAEQVARGKDYVEWGDGNAYPYYLLGLYNDVTTLRAVVNGVIDFVAGDDVVCTADLGWGTGALNRTGQTARDIVRACAKDFAIYGGFALQVIRNVAGSISEIYALDMRYLRSNNENDVFYYSEYWDDRRVTRDKVTIYPTFLADVPTQATGVVYVKNVDTQVYPAPLYAAAVKACEIERSIDEFHLNSINNSFMADTIINFNNGQPDDEMRGEIEKNINEKFSGKSNAGRIMLSFNDNKESAATIEHLAVEDYGEKYKSLASWSRQQIFTSFHCNPNLLGINTESLGFSSEEYEFAFKIFNRTQIQPIQRTIVETFGKILGGEAVRIKPFSLDGNMEGIIA